MCKMEMIILLCKIHTNTIYSIEMMSSVLYILPFLKLNHLSLWNQLCLMELPVFQKDHIFKKNDHIKKFLKRPYSALCFYWVFKNCFILSFMSSYLSPFWTLIPQTSRESNTYQSKISHSFECKKIFFQFKYLVL